MSLYADLIDLLGNSENLTASLREEIQTRARYLDSGRADAYAYQQEIEMNAETALSIMYLESLMTDVASHIDDFRMLDDLINGRVSTKTFNTRYEESRFGELE